MFHCEFASSKEYSCKFTMIPVNRRLGADLPKFLFHAPKFVQARSLRCFACWHSYLIFKVRRDNLSAVTRTRTAGMASRKCIVRTQPRPSALRAKCSTVNFVSSKEYSCKFTMIPVIIWLGADLPKFLFHAPKFKLFCKFSLSCVLAFVPDF